jgi:hypothetical protein
MVLGDGDRDAFFSDFSENVQVGSTVAKAIVDDSEEPILDAIAGEFIGPATRITVWMADWPGGVLEEGATLTRLSDASQYRVMRQRRIQDGRIGEVFCAKM